MNKKSLIRALIAGVALGILVLHPLWVSIHAYDGQHGENSSWLGFVVQAYREVFTFQDIGHVVISILAGISISVFMVMITARTKQKKIDTDNK